jgi:hypothetical protein
MIGALAFPGCPWRALSRLAGGDLNAILGLVGLAVGIAIGVQLPRSGYNLERSRKTYPAVGWIMPVIMSGLLLLLAFRVQISDSGALFFNENRGRHLALRNGGRNPGIGGLCGDRLHHAPEER